MTEHMQVPITWIICGHHNADMRKVARRLHVIADELHEQKTKMTEGRYHWALDPHGTIVRCYDTVTRYVSEWYDIDEKDRWVIEWLREAMKAVRSKMT